MVLRVVDIFVHIPFAGWRRFGDRIGQPMVSYGSGSDALDGRIRQAHSLDRRARLNSADSIGPGPGSAASAEARRLRIAKHLRTACSLTIRQCSRTSLRAKETVKADTVGPEVVRPVVRGKHMDLRNRFHRNGLRTYCETERTRLCGECRSESDGTQRAEGERESKAQKANSLNHAFRPDADVTDSARGQRCKNGRVDPCRTAAPNRVRGRFAGARADAQSARSPQIM